MRDYCITNQNNKLVVVFTLGSAFQDAIFHIYQMSFDLMSLSGIFRILALCGTLNRYRCILQYLSAIQILHFWYLTGLSIYKSASCYVPLHRHFVCWLFWKDFCVLEFCGSPLQVMHINGVSHYSFRVFATCTGEKGWETWPFTVERQKWFYWLCLFIFNLDLK